VAKGSTITIVGFGDSITLASRQPEEKKWLRLLGAMLTSKFPKRGPEMVNAGSGVNTSSEGLARIESDVLAQRPDYVLVQFGGNDATRDEARYVPLDRYDANLETIRARIAEETGAQIVMLTFPPIVDEWHQFGDDEHHVRRGGLDAHIELYRERTRAFAGCHGLPLADIDRALRAAAARDGDGTYILPDGVHLTAEGNRVVAETVCETLVSALTGADGSRE